MPRLFVVIPTKNRAEDLRRTLQEIEKQSRKPDVVVIVDDSRKEIKSHIKNLANCTSLKVDTINGEGFGLAVARNVALEHIAKNYAPEDNDIVLFLDDDIDLPDTEALEKIIHIFAARNIIGLGGYNEKSNKYRIFRTIYQSLMITPKVPDDLLALAGVFGKNEIMVKRLSGCFMAFKWKVLKKERFDNQLIRYSLGEDLDFSYRVSRHGPIIATKTIRYIHRESTAARMPSVAKEFMLITYLPYVTAKNTRWGEMIASIQAPILLLVETLKLLVLHRDARTAARFLKLVTEHLVAIRSAIHGNLAHANAIILRESKHIKTHDTQK